MAVHPSIAAGLLAWAAATDNREVTETAAIAWAEALDSRVTLADGKAAISAHRAETSDYLMPAHVNRGVLAIRRDRLERMETPQPPQGLDGHPGRELTWQREYRRAVGSGATADQAMAAACEALGVQPDRAVLEASGPPPEIQRLAHSPACSCGCLTRPVRATEGAPA